MDNFKRPQQPRGPQTPPPRPNGGRLAQQSPPARSTQPAPQARPQIVPQMSHNAPVTPPATPRPAPQPMPTATPAPVITPAPAVAPVQPKKAPSEVQPPRPQAQPVAQKRALAAPQAKPAEEDPQTPQPVEKQPDDSAKPASRDIKKNRKRNYAWLWWLGGSIAAVLVLAMAAGAWYQSNLTAPHPANDEPQQISIQEGSAVLDIARMLESEEIIKNALVFQIYYRLNSSATALQAGEYMLTRNLTVAEVIEAISESQITQYDLTFLPGESVLDVKETLLEAGFSETDIDAAFERHYPTYTMMKQRPESHDIEGFIFPDTYRFEDNYTVEDILQRPFQHMQTYVVEEGLEGAFESRGLTLYEGITLASIIQKEVNNQADMAHVSQVFHSRLEQDIPLGSDPTFVYPAHKMGVQPLPSLESPYNTYLVQGLPPGPIANPGKEALQAAAYPSTDTDDLFFVAGDDGQTYFSKTNEEHERLTREHCSERCRLDIF